MRSSPYDPTNSVPSWFKDRTLDAREQRHWKPLTSLYLDYHRYCETAGIPPSNRVSKTRFTTMLNEQCHQLGRKLMVEVEGSRAKRMELCWPRMLRSPIRVAA